jgi:lysophospholipase L1-like esterase
MRIAARRLNAQFWGILILLSFTQINSIQAQKRDKIDTALLPFWKGKVMHNESVLMLSRDGKPAEATLLFKPRRILAVTNAGLNVVYKEGVDWEYKDGKLRLLPDTKAVFMTDKEIYPESGRFKKKDGGGFVLHNEGVFFHEHQLAVTYTHKKKGWKGPLPMYQGSVLPLTLDKLQSKKPLKLLLFGDSISAGANASANGPAEPNLPAWGPLFVENLKRHFGTSIEFTNTSVGGQDSRWGARTVQENVVKYNPDLVVIAFGMNDGTGKMDPQKFKENVAEMIKAVRANNANAEFILVAPMLPNPESTFLGTQREFKKVLGELTGPGIAISDITAVHNELLKHKSYQDMTGNNINHPNDFLIRWYAQHTAGILIK